MSDTAIENAPPPGGGSQLGLSPDDVRARMFPDLASKKSIAKALNKSERTIDRLIAQGRLPVVYVGKTPYVVVSKAADALLAEAVPRHAKPRRGRPMKTSRRPAA